MRPRVAHLEGGNVALHLEKTLGPGARRGELAREDRGVAEEGVAVDGIDRAQDGDAEARVDGEIDRFKGHGEKRVVDGAGLLMLEEMTQIILAVDLLELPDLLFKGHSGKNVRNPIGDGATCVAVKRNATAERQKNRHRSFSSQINVLAEKWLFRQ